jgi:hypothetical protein
MCGNLVREDGEALQWGRHSIPRAVATTEQQRLVLDDEEA